MVGPASVCGGRYYTVTIEHPAVKLPDWIRDVLRAEPSAVSTLALPVASSTLAHRHRYVQAILQGEAERVRTARSGSRNNALNIAAYLLGQLVGSGEIRQQEAVSVLQAAASVHIGIEHFTEREMHRTITSGLTAGLRRPRYLTRQARRGADA